MKKKVGLFAGIVRVTLSFALLWSCMFAGVQVAHAKRSFGEYAGRTFPSNVFYSPQATSWTVDQAGTIWNNVDDLAKRQFRRKENVGYTASRTVAANGANTTWTIAVPTANVSADRMGVSIYNPKSNTQQFNVMFTSMSGAGVTGSFFFPSTNTWIITLAPGDRYETECSNSMHFVLMSTGTIGTEAAKVNEFVN